MTFVLGPLGASNSIFLLTLVNKLDFYLEARKSITPKFHKKSFCTQNQSFSSWYKLGEGFQMWAKVFRPRLAIKLKML